MLRSLPTGQVPGIGAWRWFWAIGRAGVTTVLQALKERHWSRLDEVCVRERPWCARQCHKRIKQSCRNARSRWGFELALNSKARPSSAEGRAKDMGLIRSVRYGPERSVQENLPQCRKGRNDPGSYLGLQVFVAWSHFSVDLQSAGPLGVGAVCATAESANAVIKPPRTAAEMSLRMFDASIVGMWAANVRVRRFVPYACAASRNRGKKRLVSLQFPAQNDAAQPALGHRARAMIVISHPHRSQSGPTIRTCVC